MTPEQCQMAHYLRAWNDARKQVKVLEAEVERLRSDAEVKKLREVLQELRDQRGRLEQMLEDHPMGTPEYRLAESLLDALDAAMKGGENGR